MYDKSDGFIPVKGGKIYYVLYGKKNDKHAPLIIAHGGPGFSHDTLEVLAPLSTDRTLILYDQLGCGRSDRPNDKSLWQLERYTTELDDIVKYFNLNRYHVLGHSFGGSIVLEHGLTHPSSLLSITLSSALVSVKDWIADTNIRKKELPKAIQLAIEKHEAQNTTDSEEYKNAIKEFNRRFLCRLDPKPIIYQKALENFNLDIYETMWGPSEFNCTGNLSSYERGDDLAQLGVPILLLCGDQDEVRKETLQKYMKNLPSSSDMYVFQDSAHNTYLEVTDNYIAVVKQFLEKVESVLDEN
ncbi:MAG: proline iminopeptidase-family hydrolase [Legionellales bacterium]|nr:proline iminopeptidase-family hydrolase [Legionellales bacterium]